MFISRSSRLLSRKGAAMNKTALLGYCRQLTPRDEVARCDAMSLIIVKSSHYEKGNKCFITYDVKEQAQRTSRLPLPLTLFFGDDRE
jgi:hypothetical protein